MLNADDLRKLAKSRKMPAYAEAFADAAKKWFPKFGIISNEAQAAAWATFATETGGFRIVKENMNYSAKRMTQVWPSRFKTLASAKPFANNPEALANKVYSRTSLGNTRKGDGFKYIGRGPLQTTGKVNYERAAKFSGLPLVDKPELVEDPDNGMMAACVFWQAMKLSQIAESGNIKQVRRVVNGGYHGLDRFMDFYKRGLKMLNSKSPKKNRALQRGDEGDDVALVLQTLAEFGYYRGPMDNKFGGGAEAAVMRFQSHAGLIVDGKAGVKTLSALKDWSIEKRIDAETFSQAPVSSFVYVNQNAIRNKPIRKNLKQDVIRGVQACYGAGCFVKCYSGGQARKGSSGPRTGSVRHDQDKNGYGRAGDFWVYLPDGTKITGVMLAKLAQWWLANKRGSVGLEMSGGGIHLDDWVTPPSGGSNLWTYKYSDNKPWGRQISAALAAGKAGRMPELYVAPKAPVSKPIKDLIEATDKETSSTKKAVGLGAGGGLLVTMQAVNPVLDAFNDAKDSLQSIMGAGLAVVGVLVLAGAGWWIWKERTKKEKLGANARKEL